MVLFNEDPEGDLAQAVLAVLMAVQTMLADSKLPTRKSHCFAHDLTIPHITLILAVHQELLLTMAVSGAGHWIGTSKKKASACSRWLSQARRAHHNQQNGVQLT